MRGPFSVHNGPFFRKALESGVCHGFRARRRHCNGHGILHGGLVMAFADGLLGHAVWEAVQVPAVTVRMTSDFLNMAVPGDWVEGMAEVTGQSGELVFSSARVYVGTREIFTARGVFKQMRKRS